MWASLGRNTWDLPARGPGGSFLCLCWMESGPWAGSPGHTCAQGGILGGQLESFQGSLSAASLRCRLSAVTPSSDQPFHGSPAAL